MKRLFISYFFTDFEDEQGWGDINIDWNHKVGSDESIRELRNHLILLTGYKGLIINNYRRMED